MKAILILATLFVLGISTVFGQCLYPVSQVSGLVNINGIAVTVTSTGVVDVNYIYCNTTQPYFVGFNYMTHSSETGGYTFNFNPAISALTLNVSGISKGATGAEEVKLAVNGAHYPIPAPGNLQSCDAMAVLTPEGNIAGCSGCPASGWSGTTINGLIHSLTVTDTVLFGSPVGVIFSLFICTQPTTGVKEFEGGTATHVFPNPFSTETTLQTDKMLNNASLTLFNSKAQQMKQIQNISGQAVSFNRDALPGGLYFLYLTEYHKTISINKLVVTD